MDNIKQPLGIITPNNLKNSDIFLLDIHYEMFPNESRKIFKKDNHLVLWNSFFGIFSKKIKISQKEFPLHSLPWLIDTIENKFWNHQADPKALPGEVNEVTIIDGEKIGINPMRHCCAENLFGYSFWNASRRSYLDDRPPHDWQIPKYMLEEGLLDQLKKISTDLGLKEYR